MRFINHALDIFFIVFHSVLILFNLFGWIYRKTRRYNLITLLLTGCSWLFLGIWYGIGYCPCTDWHWRVRLALGYDDMPYSYIKFLVDIIFGVDADARLVDLLTAILFSVAVICSILSNYSDYRAKSRN